MRADQKNVDAEADFVDFLPVFYEYLDSLYFEGYSEQLEGENPALFADQFTEFTNLYR